jgi:catechol 2,3-dioxygenase-like lactoylglutathione lyase family enzyme
MKKMFAALILVLSVTGVMRAQARPAITGIAFVRMYSADMAASDAFYKTLGYTKVSAGKGLERYGVNPAQWLEVEPLPSPSLDTRMPVVAFTTRNVRELERYLVKHKVAAVEKQEGGFTVHDPEGNLIGFVQQGAVGVALPSSPSASSRRIIHAGFIVRDRAAEDAFYRDLLGFHLYWAGGKTDASTDYVAMQVPDGTDWLEYMLNIKPDADAHLRGVMNHFSLGIAQMSDAVAALARDGCTSKECSKTQMGRDGKVQMNLYDPDQTRIEYMEFKPSGTICCSEFKGPHPTEVENK